MPQIFTKLCVVYICQLVKEGTRHNNYGLRYCEKSRKRAIQYHLTLRVATITKIEGAAVIRKLELEICGLEIKFFLISNNKIFNFNTYSNSTFTLWTSWSSTFTPEVQPWHFCTFEHSNQISALLFKIFVLNLAFFLLIFRKRWPTLASRPLGSIKEWKNLP